MLVLLTTVLLPSIVTLGAPPAQESSAATQPVPVPKPDSPWFCSSCENDDLCITESGWSQRGRRWERQ